MPSLETFLWGGVGAGISYLAIFILPELRRLLENDEPISKRRITLFVCILAVMVVGGGGLATVIGDALLPKHAAFYGAGWQTLIKGSSSAAMLFKK